MAALDCDVQILPSVGIEPALVMLSAIELERYDSLDDQIYRLEITDSDLAEQGPPSSEEAHSSDTLENALAPRVHPIADASSRGR